MIDAVTTLRVKYRFVAPEPYVLDDRMAVALPLEEGEVVSGAVKSPRTALGRLGMVATNPSPQTVPCLVDFYHFFAVKEEPRIFSPLWDFAPTLRSKIVANEYFHYRRVNTDCHVIGVRGKPLVDQWYLLVIYDARAVIEVFHQPINSVGQMVRYLIQQGISFATAKPVRNARLTPARRSEFTLGYRQLGYDFGLSDYADYEKKRSDILCGSAGRAALTRGGIVWRLAVDIVKHKRITDGPTSSVAWNGKKVGEMDGRSLVDGYLSPAEEDTICGTYKVYTHFKAQTEDRSWFPKASVWELSGYNQGYWTADNEAWYQKRLVEIQHGAKPRNAKEWRNALKDIRAGTATKVKKWYSAASDKFLQGDFSYWQD
ncbi:hypothetical protein Hypma_012080 [Hypsizygus marmoreus]|uniref:Uncharacterized protein n=1 Tax=Hypsizygus marmoreus TaxID=39966 RepID=A0A369JHL3_HYPMA|nr:hypothetical protein Hypma_012080 [Hypsizygus marmoreus]